jgi:hypothetical protein
LKGNKDGAKRNNACFDIRSKPAKATDSQILSQKDQYHVIIETELCFRQAFSALGLTAAGQSVNPKIINVQGFD